MKTILITGVSRGIGQATAEVFLEKGWRVIGTSTSGKSEIQSQNLEIYTLDLSFSDSIKTFAETLKSKNEKIDVLLNNAGINLDEEESGGPIKTDALRKVLEVNLIGLINLTERVISIINPDGFVVNISSEMAVLSRDIKSDYPSYRISKTALNMYTKTLAVRLKNKGIAVASLDPGWVKTDMGGEDAPREPELPAREIYDLVNSDIETGHFWLEGEKRSW